MLMTDMMFGRDVARLLVCNSSHSDVEHEVMHLLSTGTCKPKERWERCMDVKSGKDAWMSLLRLRVRLHDLKEKGRTSPSRDKEQNRG